LRDADGVTTRRRGAAAARVVVVDVDVLVGLGVVDVVVVVVGAAVVVVVVVEDDVDGGVVLVVATDWMLKLMECTGELTALRVIVNAIMRVALVTANVAQLSRLSSVNVDASSNEALHKVKRKILPTARSLLVPMKRLAPAVSKASFPRPTAPGDATAPMTVMGVVLRATRTSAGFVVTYAIVAAAAAPPLVMTALASLLPAANATDVTATGDVVTSTRYRIAGESVVPSYAKRTSTAIVKL
jgi:hypothetical protein